MRPVRTVLLLNPPHTAIGSRIPDEHLPPLGLLCVGGPLLDAGFEVSLLDGDLEALSVSDIVAEVERRDPDAVLMGHSGSSSVHDTVVEVARALKQACPDRVLVYGGVYPTYHWDEVLATCPEIDVIVRGEGERTTLQVMESLRQETPLESVRGIAFRRRGIPFATFPAEPIEDLDAFRVGWELVDLDRYSYWGGKRAVVVQFSRGCPHACSYCGQRGFWTRYRHRDPQRFAQELARLHREHGVELVNFADELPTGSRPAWRAFLEALVAEHVPLILVASTRASDIVRDADLLPLYRKAGFIRFLLGIESYDEHALAAVRKGARPAEDREAIRLLRAHGILSMATYVIGFHERGDRDFHRSMRHLISYDPDQIQLLYATPHRWTPFYRSVAERRVLQPDMRKWDYKHPVIETPGVPAWRVFAWFKAIELRVQLRPRVLGRMFFHRDADYRHAMRWYTRIGRRVWIHEVLEFLRDRRRLRHGPRLRDFLGAPLDHREHALADSRRQG